MTSITNPKVEAESSVPESAEEDLIGLINPGEILSIAWDGVARNKIRSLLTMLGVIIGVGAVIVMIAISAGTEAEIAAQIEGLGANLVFVQAPFGRGGRGGGGGGGGQAPALVYDDLATVAGVAGVTGAVVEQNTTQIVKAANASLTDVSVIGTTFQYPNVRDVPLDEGRFFNEKEQDRGTKVAILGASIAESLFANADPIGQSITIGNTRVAVIGVAKPKGVVGNTDFDAQIYLPIQLVFDRYLPTRFARLFGNQVRVIYAQIDEDRELMQVVEQIELKLLSSKGLGLAEATFTIQTQQDIIETRGATTEAFRNLLAWVAGVSLLVGGIGIMNIMLVSVTERTREIGIRQSVGATPNDIRFQFLAEALILSLIGGLIGIVLGVGGAFLFGTTGDLPTVIVPSSIFLAFGSAAAVGIFFGFYPANQAAKLDPIDALRHE
ncbi:MAG: putative ABC transport system permease protein [Candidatus Promineifilaceae bacterium]|jgi:putative ABC transport system permease protein